MHQKSAVIFFYCCLAASIVIYFPAQLYFLNDDFIHIPLSAKADFFQYHSFRPLAELSLYADYLVWGKNAFGFHLTNLIIHLLCCLFLYRLTYVFLKRFSVLSVDQIQAASFISAGLFLIYAFHNEATLWILGRGSSLCTLFFLIAMICWLKKEEHIIYFFLSLLIFTAGLLTYEAIWIMPVFVSLLHLYERRTKEIEKNQTIFLICFISVFIIYLVIRYIVLGELLGEYELSSLQGNFLLQIFLNYNRLVARSFLPPMSSTFLFCVCYLLLMLFLMLIFIKKRNQLFSHQPILLLIVMFLFSLVPFVFFGIDTHTAESERFLYLPSVFLCISIGLILASSSLPKTVFYLLLIFFFFYNIFFACSNSRDHRIAGAISNKVLQKVSQYSTQHTIIEVDHLPAQLRGVPLFRKGFKEGVKWLYQTDTGNIIIQNTITLTNGAKYFDDPFSTSAPLDIQMIQKENDTVILDIIPDEKFFQVNK